MEKFKRLSGEEIVAGCGMIVRRSEGFVCPYFARRDEWNKQNKGYGPCGIDLQVGTNVCLHAIDADDLEFV